MRFSSSLCLIVGVIFVIDSNDRERIQEAAQELRSILAMEELRDAVILILANKKDLPNAMKPTEIVKALDLPSFCRQTWHVQSTCATTREGLFEGFNWLDESLSKLPSSN